MNISSAPFASSSLFASSSSSSAPSLWSSNSSNSSFQTHYWLPGNLSFFRLAWIAASSLLCILTTVGNLLVIVAFRKNPKLTTTNNYFLVSLAVADLAIGIISMPISTFYFYMEEWVLGELVCDLWLSIDYTLSNASVANLILISFDRYFSITRPLTYRVNRTARKVVLAIMLSWIISILIWVPFIILWPYLNGKRTIASQECRVQFLYANKTITLATATAAFFLPVTIISIIYFKIYMETERRNANLHNLMGKILLPQETVRDSTKNRSRLRRMLDAFVDKDEEEEEGENSALRTEASAERKSSRGSTRLLFILSCFKTLSPFKRCSTSSEPRSRPTRASNQRSSCGDEQPAKHSYFTIVIQLATGDADLSGASGVRITEMSDQQQSSNQVQSTRPARIVTGLKRSNSNKQEKKQDKKAAKTLSAILLAFVLTWTPYNINVVVNTFCGQCLDKHELWQSFAYWLCYMNSTINPFLYALCNSTFRRTFKQILTCSKVSNR
nr:G protein-coupled receptor [Proales similis]